MSAEHAFNADQAGTYGDLGRHDRDPGPSIALRGRFRVAAWLSALIIAECVVLAPNGGRWPLTDLAARFTTERAANFDNYLPRWLAENNKMTFGGLFVVGELVWLWQRVSRRRNPKSE